MSRILVVALVCALSLASVSFGFEPGQTPSYTSWQSGGSGLRPSGLRFPDATVSIRTGDGEVAAPGGVEMAAPCNSCGQYGNGQLGQCIPWTVLPWYGSWDSGHHGHHRWGGCRSCGGGGF